jgi:hypothetical protein
MKKIKFYLDGWILKALINFVPNRIGKYSLYIMCWNWAQLILLASWDQGYDLKKLHQIIERKK